MRTNHAAAVLLAVGVAVPLAGCGSGASTAPGTGVSASTATGSCPTSTTRSFAKTRFVADLGFAAGSFHRWIYKPWRAGAFDKGANGRTLAIAKAVGTAALDLKLLKDAQENAQADPTLCPLVAGPLKDAVNAYDSLKSRLVGGDLSVIGSAETAIQGALSGSKAGGLPVTETETQPAG